jgi:hypothetical protein
MHRKNILQYVLLVCFFLLTYIYYTTSLGGENTDKIFITITTFFFSIFTSFFITRQGNRYTKLREIISTYDGKMSGIFRVASNLSPEIQQKVGEIIKSHYQKIIETKSWDYHFTHKSSTISSIHAILETDIGDSKQETLRNQAVGRVLTNLGDCQVLRKNMVMLFQEKIPNFQWLLILLFVIILLATISVIPSVGFLLGAGLKAAFAVAILSVILILKNLDDLHLFENFIGENSAKDVLATIEGSK